MEKQCEDCGKESMENWYLCGDCHIHRIDAYNQYNKMKKEGFFINNKMEKPENQEIDERNERVSREEILAAAEKISEEEFR